MVVKKGYNRVMLQEKLPRRQPDRIKKTKCPTFCHISFDAVSAMTITQTKVVQDTWVGFLHAGQNLNDFCHRGWSRGCSSPILASWYEYFTHRIRGQWYGKSLGLVDDMPHLHLPKHLPHHILHHVSQSSA